MTYVLTLFLCISGQDCITQKTLPIEYPKYYDCVSDGYITAYSSLMKLGVENVEQNKYLVTFKCRGVKSENI